MTSTQDIKEAVEQAWKPGDHDDFCAQSRFRNVACDCGADDARRIVQDVTSAFADDLKRIMGDA